MTGFVCIDKPPGITSFQVVRRIRKLCNIKKVGHSGTLDPFASGLMVIGIGRTATRRLQSKIDLDKGYDVTMQLWASSDTGDPTGNMTYSIPTFPLNITDLQDAFVHFSGPQLQTPPAYCAKHIDGVRAYKLARQGKPVKLPPAPITIHSLTLQSISDSPSPVIQFQVFCSKGTYIRQLVMDIGTMIGIPTLTTKLTRIAIGPHRLTDAIPYDSLTLSSIMDHLFLQ